MSRLRLERFKQNLKDPLNIRDDLLFKLASLTYKKNNGFFIFDEEWDSLIILDACRYDAFKEQYIKRNMKGTLEKKKSRGAHTISFLSENFKNKRYDDIVYITANPYVDRYLKKKSLP